jgi:hypothetical protein
MLWFVILAADQQMNTVTKPPRQFSKSVLQRMVAFTVDNYGETSNDWATMKDKLHKGTSQRPVCSF